MSSMSDPVSPPRSLAGPLTLAVGLGCFFLHLVSAAPGLYFMDSGELTAAAYALGTAHPPGFPAHTLIGKLLTFLPLGSIAFRLVLLSALAGALTVALAFRLAVELGRELGYDEPVAILGALAAALVLGLPQYFWRQATVTEVYTISSLALALGLWLLLGVLRTGDPRRALCLALLAGLAVAGTHPTFRLLLLPILVVGWLVAWRRGRRWAYLAPFAFGLGGLLVLYLAAVAGRSRVPDWADATTLGSLWDHFWARRIREAAFAPLMWTGRLEVVRMHLGLAYEAMLSPLIGLALPLAAVGAVRSLLHGGVARSLGGSLLLVALLDLGYAVWVNPMGLADLQNGVSFLLAVALLAGLGLAEIATAVSRGSALLRVAVAATLVVMTALPVALDALGEKWRGADPGAAAWTDAALAQAPPSALVLTESDDLSAGLLFAQAVEGARPDVLVLVRQHLWVPSHVLPALRRWGEDLLAPDLTAEYLGRSRAGRIRGRANFLAQLLGRADGRFPVLWESGDGSDEAALTRPLVPGVPLFRLAPGSGPPPPSGSPAAHEAEVRRVLHGCPGDRTAMVRSRHLNALGRAYLPPPGSRASLEPAARLFDQALRAWPASVAAQVNAAVVLAEQGERLLAAGRVVAGRRLVRGAVDRIERVLEAEPDRYPALMNAGRYRLRLAETADPRARAEVRLQETLARGHFQRAARVFPERSAPWFNLGVVAARGQRYAEARAHLRRALRIAPNDAAARTYLERVESLLARP